MTRDARAFWTYWGAGTLSSAGTAVTAVALPLTAVTVLDATPFQMGMVAAASYLAWILIGLPAGVITQRLPLRRTQVACDLVRALAIASVPIAWWSDLLSIGHLVVTALVINLAEVVFFAANATFMVSVVPKEELNARNSLMSGTHAVTQLGGPSLGGLLVQVMGAVPALLVDAASYVASAVLLRRLPERELPQPEARTAVREMIADGWRFVTRHPVMAPATWWACVVNFVCGAQLALFALYLVRDLDAPAGVVGLLLATEGVGALAFAALTPWLVRRIGSARVLLVEGLLGAASAALIPWGHGWVGWIFFAVGNCLFAGSVVPGSVVTRTYRQVASPPELLSRVMATVRFVSWGVIPVGGLVAGGLAEAIGARTTLLMTAPLMLIGPLLVWWSPIRHLRDLEDYGTPTLSRAAG
ncbi:MFS transporter [Nocardioides gansuensis]|uniref:MFS transporter n=1 Tax=Nocardioides gansuensis TaxID=2138300 RepID=A0A2T8F6L4_9ACTN|nr:MFS transporter [Nocardioides gansuensis]PVG81346.1 MFS transporter [Nocardioides gansuensis]